MTLVEPVEERGIQTAYRIVKKKYRYNAFDGEGARLYGGRWNSKGKKAVYLSDAIPLAILEILVHLDDQAVLSEWCLFESIIPEDQILELPARALPQNWREHPAPVSTMVIGDTWLRGNESLALKVPSVTVPMGGHNLILNPSHPEFEKLLETMRWQPIEIDPRLAR